MSVDAPARNVSPLASLANPDLRKLYAAEVVSGAGDGVFWVALVVFVSDQPRFGLWLTLAVVARLVPRAVLSLPAGSLVDRSNVRRMLVSVELVRGAVMGALAVVVGVDGPPGLVIALVLASYCVGAPTRPAVSAIVPAIAGERHLAVANAVISTVRQIMTFVGPLLGVAVVAWSTTGGFAVNAATFVLSGLLMAAVSGIPSRVLDHGHRVGLLGSIRDGAQAVARIDALPALVGLIAVVYFVRGAEMVLHVYVVRDLLDADVGTIGVLGGAIGLGALLAMPIAARSAGSDSPVRPVLVAVVCTAVPTAALALIENVLWASAVLVFVGVGMVLFEVVIVVMMQRVTPPESLGRVFGAVNGASNGGKLVGALLAPVAIAAFGVRWSLVTVAALVLLGALLAVRPLVVFGRVAAERRRQLAPRVAGLARLDIFEGAPQSSLERIAAEIDELDVSPGTVVIREGDEADDLFVVRSGELEVTVAGSPVGALEAGDWFGEIGLLGRRPRTASVTAVGESTLWRIPGDTFLEVLEESGAPPSALMDAMADRLAAHG